MLIIIGGALSFENIASSDYGVGAVLAISGILAIAASVLYRKPETQIESNLNSTAKETPPKEEIDPFYKMQDDEFRRAEEEYRKESAEKRVIKEKEIVVKITCLYCQNLYDETLDRCPHCGGHRPAHAR